jgi:hypothetical protein
MPRCFASSTLSILKCSASEYNHVSISAGVLGYMPEEVIGTSTFDSIHPEDTAFVRQTFASSPTSGTTDSAPPNEMHVVRRRAKDGSWKWIERTAFVYTDVTAASVGLNSARNGRSTSANPSTTGKASALVSPTGTPLSPRATRSHNSAAFVPSAALPPLPFSPQSAGSPFKTPAPLTPPGSGWTQICIGTSTIDTFLFCLGTLSDDWSLQSAM